MRLRRRRSEPPVNPGPSGGTGGSGGPHYFGIRTLLARAAGKDGRYKLSAIRALPSRKPNTAVLQATDGQQAVCLITTGTMRSSRLVPADVLPSRRNTEPTLVDVLNGQWQSSDGKTAPDVFTPEDGYPKIADVLPKFSPRVGKPPVQLGIDVTLLNKLADALGTPKLTLFIPVIDKTRPDKTPAGGTVNGGFVKKPVAVCPANDAGKVRGVGVFMPLQPVNGVRFYETVRRLVAEAEAMSKPKARKQEAAPAPPQNQPA